MSVLFCVEWRTWTAHYFSHCDVYLIRQYIGDEEREIEGRGSVSSRQRKLRILRAGQDVASAAGHHFPAGQGLHHPIDHFVPSTKGLFQ